MITLNDGRLASSFDDNKIRISSNNNVTDFYNYNNQSVILTGHTDFVNVIIQQQVILFNLYAIYLTIYVVLY
jgi:hypothetical protein